MICPDCGTNNPEDSKFCLNCKKIFQPGTIATIGTESAPINQVGVKTGPNKTVLLAASIIGVLIVVLQPPSTTETLQGGSTAYSSAQNDDTGTFVVDTPEQATVSDPTKLPCSLPTPSGHLILSGDAWRNNDLVRDRNLIVQIDFKEAAESQLPSMAVGGGTLAPDQLYNKVKVGLQITGLCEAQTASNQIISDPNDNSWKNENLCGEAGFPNKDGVYETSCALAMPPDCKSTIAALRLVYTRLDCYDSSTGPGVGMVSTVTIVSGPPFDSPNEYQEFITSELSELLDLDVRGYGGKEAITSESVYFIMYYEVDWITDRFFAVEVSRQTGEIIKYKEIGNDACPGSPGRCPNISTIWWTPQR
jgi:hypothetical protein